MSDEPGAAGPVAPAENLARFIFSSSHFSRENNRVKHNAFMPAPDGKSQPLHARADIAAAELARVNLTVALSEPPPRHCNIEGWPAEKSAQKLIAMDLADAAGLVLKP